MHEKVAYISTYSCHVNPMQHDASDMYVILL